MIKIKRACKPGETNVNGITYDLESYNEALKTFGERIKYGMPVELISQEQYQEHLKNQNCFVDPEKCCGKIIDIYDDYIVIEPNSTYSGKLLMDLIDSGIELNAFMRYIGDKDQTTKVLKVRNIVTFDIMEELNHE